MNTKHGKRSVLLADTTILNQRGRAAFENISSYKGPIAALNFTVQIPEYRNLSKRPTPPLFDKGIGVQDFDTGLVYQLSKIVKEAAPYSVYRWELSEIFKNIKSDRVKAAIDSAQKRKFIEQIRSRPDEYLSKDFNFSNPFLWAYRDGIGFRAATVLIHKKSIHLSRLTALVDASEKTVRMHCRTWESRGLLKFNRSINHLRVVARLNRAANAAPHDHPSFRNE